MKEKLNGTELSLCSSGLDMERLYKKKKRAERRQRNNSSLKRKLKKAALYSPRIAMYSKYDCEKECRVPPLKWGSLIDRSYLKTSSNRMIIRTPIETFTGKGSRYKRLFEYWWTIY